MEQTYNQNGYNASETTMNANPVNQGAQQDPVGYTSDTGYFNEDILQKYANVILAITIILCVIFVAASTMIASRFDQGFMGFILSSIIAVIAIMLAYVMRAFIMVFANMSINLHELNMKVKG